MDSLDRRFMTSCWTAYQSLLVSGLTEAVVDSLMNGSVVNGALELIDGPAGLTVGTGLDVGDLNIGAMSEEHSRYHVRVST